MKYETTPNSRSRSGSSIKWRPETKEAIEAECARQNCSMNHLVNELVAQALGVAHGNQ